MGIIGNLEMELVNLRIALDVIALIGIKLRRKEKRVKKILKQIAEQRYSSSQTPYKIFDTDREARNFFGTWDSLELRWPKHYAGWIDSISLYRKEDTMDVNVFFKRGKREISSSAGKTSLEQQAQQIYETIKAELTA